MSYQINNLIEMKEHSHVPLGTTYEPKPIPQGSHHTLYNINQMGIN